MPYEKTILAQTLTFEMQSRHKSENAQIFDPFFSFLVCPKMILEGRFCMKISYIILSEFVFLLEVLFIWFYHRVQYMNARYCT
eukprot:SAG11_NODE_2080_length_3853_cov_12.378796_5_plen_83_part_00